MALARIRSLEQLRYQAPGEWGKLLGLDRIPEVRTLRAKLKRLCQDWGRAVRWNAELAKEWIARQNASELYFYCDGHVRVYHGDQTALPRHDVARERLCLRATTDYWINANALSSSCANRRPTLPVREPGSGPWADCHA